MKNLGQHLAGAISLAVVTGGIWWWVNSAFGNRKGGFLDTGPWPWNNVWLCVTIAAAIGFVVSLLTSAMARRRARSMEAAAALLGLSFAPVVSRNALGVPRHLRAFDDWVEGTNYMSGRIDEHEIQILDVKRQYTTTSADGPSNTHTVYQTVFLLPLGFDTGLSVEIRPKRGWLLSMLGFEGIEFSLDDSFAAQEDRELIRRFNEAYLVTEGRPPHEPDEEPSVSAAPEDVLRKLEDLISVQLLKLLMETRDFSVEIQGPYVAVWQEKKLTPPSKIRDTLDKVLQICEYLEEGPADGNRMRLKVTGQVSMEVGDIRFQNLGVLVGGGCVGAFLAFATFVPVFFLFVQKAPWIVFIWPFYGMAVIATCVYFGTRFVRKRTKNSSAQNS